MMTWALIVFHSSTWEMFNDDANTQDCLLKVLRLASERVFVPLTVGGGIREFTDGAGKYHSALDVAAEYFRSGADKVSIGSDAVYAAEGYLKTGKKSGRSSIEQISWVSHIFPTSKGFLVMFAKE